LTSDWNKGNKYVVHFDEFSINFNKKIKIKDGREEDIPREWIIWGNIVFTLWKQQITISEEWVRVQWI
jgi:hypothetical protein